MPLPNEPIWVPTQSVKEMIFHALRKWIVIGILEPGEKISDLEIANYFNVSKTPVREAFQLLESQKLIKTFPRKETRVTELQTNNIEVWYLPIIALESLAASLACKNANDGDIVKLQQYNDSIDDIRISDELILSDKAIQMMDFDRKFHNHIIEIARNPYIADFLETLHCHIQRLEYTFFERGLNFKRSKEEHNNLLGAFVEKDCDKAQDLMRAHWTRSLRDLKSILEQGQPNHSG